MKRRWRQVEQLANAFWKRFTGEYISSLGQRTKWLVKRRNFAVGDLVIVAEPNQPRSQWPLARVTSVKEGQDGLVRSCSVKTSKSTYERPITKLVLLEGHSDAAPQ